MNDMNTDNQNMGGEGKDMDQKIKCGICGAEFESEAEHEEHMKNEHGSKKDEDKGETM